MGNYQSQFTGEQIDERLSAVPGKYVKPSGGIPSTDMTSAVQTSLAKADTALQSVPSTYRKAAAQDTIDAGKADKVAGAVSGNFAGLDGNGNLTDSGKDASDFDAAGAAASAVSAHDESASAHASKFSVVAAAIAAKYEKPSAGIPESDLADAARKVRTAVYGTTTFATMKGWLDNGDVVRCVMGSGSDMIGYVTYYSANKIHFLASSLDTGVSGEIGICVVANGQGEGDVWTYGTFQPENAGNKVDTIGATPSSSKYPSEYCLAQALAGVAGDEATTAEINALFS